MAQPPAAPPPGSGPQPTPSSSSQPPINPDKRLKTMGRRQVSVSTPTPQFSTGQPANPAASQPASQPSAQPVTDRTTTPVAEPEQTTPVQQQAPEQQLKALHKQLQGQLADFWVRDQLSIIQKIMDDPALAAKMGIKIEIQLPESPAPVQLYPILEGDDAPSEDERTLCEQKLAEETAKLSQHIASEKGVDQLFGEYLQTRQQFIGLSQAVEPNFEWKVAYEYLLRMAINSTHEGQEMAFTFIREKYDPSKKLGQDVLDELARPAKKVEDETPPPAPEDELPDNTSTLKKPRLEFRMRATEEDIARSKATLNRQESSASSASGTDDEE